MKVYELLDIYAGNNVDFSKPFEARPVRIKILDGVIPGGIIELKDASTRPADDIEPFCYEADSFYTTRDGLVIEANRG